MFGVGNLSVILGMMCYKLQTIPSAKDPALLLWRVSLNQQNMSYYANFFRQMTSHRHYSAVSSLLDLNMCRGYVVLTDPKDAGPFSRNLLGSQMPTIRSENPFTAPGISSKQIVSSARSLQPCKQLYLIWTRVGTVLYQLIWKDTRSMSEELAMSCL